MRRSVTSASTYGGRRSILANFLLCLSSDIFKLIPRYVSKIQLIVYFNVMMHGISITIGGKMIGLVWIFGGKAIITALWHHGQASIP